ncbi:MAG: PQQ-binding-like beta-propeller repeat protein [Planctomycetaceae bacterium]
MKFGRHLATAAFATLLVLFSATVFAQDNWPRFRGLNGVGTSDQKGFPTKWTADDYAWNIKLPGKGHSSPVIWGDNVFLTSAVPSGENSERLVLCLDADSGATKWKRNVGLAASHLHKKNSWASGSPATDGQMLFVAFADTQQHKLVAFDFNGKSVWTCDLGEFQSQHGQGSSPIVVDDLVILPNDQMGPSEIVAVHKATGEIAWRTERAIRKTSYATPMIFDGKSGRQLICVSGANGICGLDIRTGEMKWQTEAFPMRTVASPILAGGLVFASCGSGGQGKLMFGVDPEADKSSDRVRIRRQRTLPYVPTPIEHDGRLYLWTDRGVVVCLNANDGSEVWAGRVRGNFSGSPICIDGKLYCMSEAGDVVVLEAGMKFNLLGRTSLGGASYATPAVAGGRLYLRTFDRLMCLAAKK